MSQVKAMSLIASLTEPAAFISLTCSAVRGAFSFVLCGHLNLAKLSFHLSFADVLVASESPSEAVIQRVAQPIQTVGNGGSEPPPYGQPNLIT